jgi:hypothetical protein
VHAHAQASEGAEPQFVVYEGGEREATPEEIAVRARPLAAR